MNAKRKLIPAVALLLISAIMLSTASYAWFSMNTTVTASTMQITAKADNPFLQISEAEDTGFTTALTLTAASATDLKLATPLNLAVTDPKTTYYEDAAAKTAGTTTEISTAFTNAASVQWGTTVSTATNNAQAANVTTLVDNANLGEYALSKELWFKVAQNSTNGANLKLSAVTFAAGANTIAASARVLIVTEAGKYMLYDAGANTITGDAALLDTLTTTAIKATAYFYFDGTDADAYTDLATDLTAVTAVLTFAID